MGFLSGVSDAIFGSKGSVDTNAKSTLSKEQRDALNKFLLPFLTGSPISDIQETPYAGQLTAPLTGTEQGIQDILPGLLSGISGTAGQAEKTLGGLLNPTPADWESYFTKSIQDPMLKNFHDVIAPAIGREYAPSGFFGGERMATIDRAGKDLNDSLVAARAKTGYDAYQAAQDRALSAVGAAGSFGTATAGALGGLETTASTPRTVQQADFLAQYQEFLRQQQNQKQKERVSQLLQALGLPAIENIGAAQPAQSGLLQSFLGTGAGSGLLAGGISSLFTPTAAALPALLAA